MRLKFTSIVNIVILQTIKMRLTQLFLLFKVSICAMNGGQAESGEIPVRSDEMIAIFFVYSCNLIIQRFNN